MRRNAALTRRSAELAPATSWPWCAAGAVPPGARHVDKARLGRVWPPLTLVGSGHPRLVAGRRR